MGAAACRHQVLTDDELWALGLTPTSKRNRRERGVIDVVVRGVNLVGTDRPTLLGRARIGELAGGPGAFVTGWAALRIRRIVDFEPALLLVATPNRRRDVRHPAVTLRFQRTRRLAEDERSTVDGVLIATACRAIFDLAGVVEVQRLVRLLREAVHRRLASVDELEAIALRYRSTPNAARVREAVHVYRTGGGGSRSRTEAEIYAAIVNAWIVPARLNRTYGVFVDGHEIEFDVTWPGHPLDLELDGDDHLDVAVARRDARRDRAARAAGFIPKHVMNDEFAHNFDDAVADLIRDLERFAPPGYHEAVARGEIT